MNLKTIFKLWLPLAVSFELMMLEGPVVQSAIGRLASPSVNLAAWGLTISLSLLVESPVIMLLATAIALTHGQNSYLALRKFTLNLLVWCTVLTAAVAFTPLFEFVTITVMRQPESIVMASKPAMQIMLFWTAAIAWRRFLQGVMIRHGQTRMVSWGTLVRLIATVSCAAILLRAHSIPGVQLGAITLMVAVITEAVATTFFARRTLREKVLVHDDSAEPALTQARIWKYHTPLAATTLLTLLANPLTATALARLENPKATLAAWPVAGMLLLVIRGWGLAIQEITVSISREHGERNSLRQFAWIVGAISSGVTLLMVVTPLLDLYLNQAIHMPLYLQGYVRVGLLWGSILPLITALGSWIRGVLMAEQRTHLIYRGMGINLGTNILLLIVSVLLQLPGMVAGAMSFVVAAIAELVYLLSQRQKKVGAHGE